jgi:hypothetical protein
VSELSLLSARDSPVAGRLRALAASELPQGDKVRLEKKLKAQQRQARYDDFFHVLPLVNLLFTFRPSVTERRDTALVYLKLVTCMRSADVSQLLPSIFLHQHCAYIRTVSKGERYRSFRIGPAALFFIWRYYSACPTPVFPRRAMFECHSTPHAARRPLGAERVAKATLMLMNAAGVSTGTFKSHALRGAATTHFLESGAEPTAVRHRGGWLQPGDSFALHYGRSHQSQDWERFLSPPDGFLPPSVEFPGPLSNRCLLVQPATSVPFCNLQPHPLPPRSSGPEAEPEGRRRRVEDEGEGVGFVDAVLYELGRCGAVILEGRRGELKCFCGVPPYWEPALECAACDRVVHLRCLSLCRCGRPIPDLPELSSKRPRPGAPALRTGAPPQGRKRARRRAARPSADP